MSRFDDRSLAMPNPIDPRDDVTSPARSPDAARIAARVQRERARGLPIPTVERPGDRKDDRRPVPGEACNRDPPPRIGPSDPIGH
jgi:hypothetical protein